MFLIGLVVAARTFAYQISSLYVVIGVAVVASILFIIAIIGIVSAIKHHQVILFFVSSKHYIYIYIYIDSQVLPIIN